MNERIQISYYVGVVFKWLWLIILLVLVTSGLTAYFSLTQPKQWTSTERILLTPAVSSDVTQLYAASTSQSLADSYSTYMQSLQFGQQVATRINTDVHPNPPMTAGEVVGAISTNLVKADAVFFDIISTSGDPVRAQMITKSAVDVLIVGYNQATYGSNTSASDYLTQRKAITDQIDFNQSRAKDAEDELARYAAEAPPADPAANSSREARIDGLYTRLSTISQVVANLESQLTTLTQQNNGGNLQNKAGTIIDTASVGAALPNNTTRNVSIVAALTLVFGIGMALLFDFLDYTIKAADDLENLLKVAPLGVIGKISPATLSRLTVLAANQSVKDKAANIALPLVDSVQKPENGALVDSFAGDANSGSADSGTPADGPNVVSLPTNPTPSSYEVRLITALQPKSTIAEAFRVLRTNILFSQMGKPLRSLSVTSSIQGEGKTVTAGNLAVVFAQAGKTVLLVDADLRRPRLHAMFDLPNNVGFSNVALEGIDKHPDAIYETSVRRLLVMPSGPVPPNPSELLGSRRVEELLARVRDYIDIVIFDTPPAAAVTDAMVLATKVDGVLIVVQSGRTRRDIILKTYQAIGKVGGSIIGPVLNQVTEQSLRSYYYYNYGYGYGYYDDAPEGTAKKGKAGSAKVAAAK